jgi:hypothetical protein
MQHDEELGHAVAGERAEEASAGRFLDARAVAFARPPRYMARRLSSL